jgi:hypothetical protein
LIVLARVRAPFYYYLFLFLFQELTGGFHQSVTTAVALAAGYRPEVV